MSQIALVTGANRGLGYAIAEQLGRVGATVLMGARDPAAGDRAADELRRAGVEAYAVQLDVTDPASIGAARARIDDRYGSLDILVNNAAVLPEWELGSLQAPVRADMFRRTLETNVVGPAAVTEAMLPLLMRAPAGRIVNVSSAIGSLTLAADPSSPASAQIAPAYQASKAALNSLTVALSKLLSDTNITVTSVCPGFMQTDIHPPDHRAKAPLTAAQAAEFVVSVALDTGRPSGHFVDREGELPW